MQKMGFWYANMLIQHFLIAAVFKNEQASGSIRGSGKASGEDMGLCSDLTYRNSLTRVVSVAELKPAVMMCCRTLNDAALLASLSDLR